MTNLEKRFLPFCDHEYANREDNAVNCAEVADEFAIGFAEWLRANTKHKKGGPYKLHNDFQDYNLSELLNIYKNKNGL